MKTTLGKLFYSKRMPWNPESLLRLVAECALTFGTLKLTEITISSKNRIFRHFYRPFEQAKITLGKLFCSKNMPWNPENLLRFVAE